MKTLILIDLSSIQKNPNAGNTITYLFGDQNAEFECNKIPEFLIENKHYILTETNITDKKEKYKGILIQKEFTNDLIELFQKWAFDNKINNTDYFFNITWDRSIIEVSHIPEPKYFYNYENPYVKCSYCEADFLVGELESDELDDVFIDKICPKCGMSGCVDIIFESIEDALKRKNHD
jgi:hypothetical protein